MNLSLCKTLSSNWGQICRVTACAVIIMIVNVGVKGFEETLFL